MSQLKKFAWSGATVALAVLVSMAMLVSTVSAAVTLIAPATGQPNIIAPGGSTVVQATYDPTGAPAVGTSQQVFFVIDASGSTASGNLGNAQTAAVTCTVQITASATGTQEYNCDDSLASVRTDEVAAPLTITLRATSTSGSGQIQVQAFDQENVTNDTVMETTVFVVSGAAGTATDIVVVSAPQTIHDPGGTASITVRVNDAAGNPINGQTMTATTNRGLLSATAQGGVCNTAGNYVATSCTATTATQVSSTTGVQNPGRVTVSVMENGTLGENVEVTFFTPQTGTQAPAVEQVSMEIVGQAAPGQVTITASPSPIPAGGTSTITVTAKDADGDVVGDNTLINVEATAGSITGCSNNPAGDFDTGNTRNGVVTCTYTAPPTAQTVTLTATAVTPSGADIVVTTSLQVTGTAATATATATTAPTCTGAIISGSIPRTGGFGLIVAGCGTIQQVEANTGCPIATMALWATRAGNFIVHVPGTQIGAVNAEFFTVFPGGNIPQNEPFVGKCV